MCDNCQGVGTVTYRSGKKGDEDNTHDSTRLPVLKKP